MKSTECRYTMPPGEITGWDVVQECQGYQLAKDFARQWLVDHDPGMSVVRLGFSGTHKEAQKLGHTIYGHHLTQSFIREETKNFAKKHKIDEPTILEMLMDEAKDKGFGSNQGARVRALSTLLTHIAPPKKEAGDDPDDMPVVNVFLNTKQLNS